MIYSLIESWFSREWNSSTPFLSLDGVLLRDFLAFLTALLLALVFGRWFIAYQLRHRRVEWAENEDSEQLSDLHRSKNDTPTMGGVIFLVAMSVATLLWSDLSNRFVWLLLGVVLALGLLGFADDLIKFRGVGRKGLSARGKLLAQLSLGGLIGAYLYFFPLMDDPGAATALYVPVLKVALPLGILFIALVSFICAGASNAVNLTDGLDGLAIGCSVVAGIPFALAAVVSGSETLSSHFLMPHVLGSLEVSVFASAFVGSGLGFLYFNRHPARIFMGDTGALALGGALGLMAILTKKELFLVLVGGVFIVETLSVMLQVASFKLRGKRIFLIAPLHHHFQFKGWEERRVTLSFWIAAVFLATISVVTLRFW